MKLAYEVEHAVLHAIAQAEIATLPPALHGIAAAFQEGAQRPRRDIRRHKSGQHEHRVTIAFWRQAQQRQRAKKRAEFVKGPSFEKHQGFGRRLQRLRGRGHQVPLK